MLIDPYLTTIASPYKVDALTRAVVAEAVHHQFRGTLFEVGEHCKDVPNFTQPLVYQMPASRDFSVAVDMRPFKGGNPFTAEQADLMRLRAHLTVAGYQEEGMSRFYHPAAQAAYAHIVAGVIAGKFGIDPHLKFVLTIVAAAHYYNMTHESTEGAYDDRTQLLLTNDISKMLRLPADTVDVVLQRMSNVDTLMGLVANIKAADGTDRTAQLSPGILVNGSAGLWFGVNHSETMAVAFEHAPTFCALLYAALGEGSYSRSEMAKRLKSVPATRQKADSFRQSIRMTQMEYADV